MSPGRTKRGELKRFGTIYRKIDSRVKSRFSLLKSVFKMRKTGIKNTYDAGVKIGNLRLFISISLAFLLAVLLIPVLTFLLFSLAIYHRQAGCRVLLIFLFLAAKLNSSESLFTIYFIEPLAGGSHFSLVAEFVPDFSGVLVWW